MALGSDLLALPFSELVAQLAIGIAEAQRELDRNTVARILELARALKPPASAPEEAGPAGNPAAGPETVVAALERLKEVGLLPTFYQFVDTEIEVRMAISTARERSLGAQLGARLSAVTVDASYAQKFGYRGEGSSVLRTKIVPVAPPEQLAALLRAAEAHGLLEVRLPSLPG